MALLYWDQRGLASLCECGPWRRLPYSFRSIACFWRTGPIHPSVERLISCPGPAIPITTLRPQLRVGMAPVRAHEHASEYSGHDLDRSQASLPIHSRSRPCHVSEALGMTHTWALSDLAPGKKGCSKQHSGRPLGICIVDTRLCPSAGPNARLPSDPRNKSTPNSSKWRTAVFDTLLEGSVGPDSSWHVLIRSVQ